MPVRPIKLYSSGGGFQGLDGLRNVQTGSAIFASVAFVSTSGTSGLAMQLGSWLCHRLSAQARLQRSGPARTVRAPTDIS